MRKLIVSLFILTIISTLKPNTMKWECTDKSGKQIGAKEIKDAYKNDREYKVISTPGTFAVYHQIYRDCGNIGI